MIDPSLIVFLATVIVVFFLVGRFQIQTYLLVKKIQFVAKRQGATWDFWTDHARLSAFVFSPEQLLASSDTEEMASTKRQLLHHRNGMRRALLLMGAIMLLGFVVGIGIPLARAIVGR